MLKKIATTGTTYMSINNWVDKKHYGIFKQYTTTQQKKNKLKKLLIHILFIWNFRKSKTIKMEIASALVCSGDLEMDCTETERNFLGW